MTESIAPVPFKTGLVPIDRITDSKFAIRQVDTESEGFMNLCDSVKRNGVLSPIMLRPAAPGLGEGDFDYVLIDGLHRFTAAKAVGAKEINANVYNVDDATAMELQFIANNQRVETKPVEYARHILRLLSANPTMTVPELSMRFSRSTQYLTQILGLLKLPDSIQKVVNEGEVTLANAIQLSRLKDKDDPIDYLDKALTMDTMEFAELVKTRNEEVAKAAREGRVAAPNTFIAVAHLRKLSELKDEQEKALIGPALVADSGIKTAEEGFALGLKWVLNLDAPTVAAAKAKWEAAEAAKAEKRKQAQEKREAAKAAKAADTAVKAEAQPKDAAADEAVI